MSKLHLRDLSPVISLLKLGAESRKHFFFIFQIAAPYHWSLKGGILKIYSKCRAPVDESVTSLTLNIFMCCQQKYILKN